VLIQVAIALAALLGFAVLTVDYGVMWASRRQAQNAADAGALAGAISLAFDDADDVPRARASAVATGTVNSVWGLNPNIDPATDVIIGACPPGAPGLPDTCVRVNVFRNQTKDPLPTFFGPILGITSQGVRATATAQVMIGNASDCLKPWAVPDKWFDIRDEDAPIDSVWTADDRFERYYDQGPDSGQLMPDPVDVYAPPSQSGPGSGYQLPGDYGRRIVLKVGNPQQAVAPGWFFPIDLPRGSGPATGGDKYRENIASCNGVPVAIGEEVVNEPGNMIGPTGQGMDLLYDQDPTAYWDEATKTIKDSCAAAVPPCAARSPRLVAVPLFNVDAYAAQDKQSGRLTFAVTNIIGVFLDRPQGNTVVGHFMNFPGVFKQGVGEVGEESSFLKTVILVR
jgi:hypothetical protein